MTKRKTISVESLVDDANHMLLHSKDDLREQRLGVAVFIEGIMFKTGRYSGFRYLDREDMEKSELGRTQGIIFDAVNHDHSYPDDSRRQYGLKAMK